MQSFARNARARLRRIDYLAIGLPNSLLYPKHLCEYKLTQEQYQKVDIECGTLREILYGAGLQALDLFIAAQKPGRSARWLYAAHSALRAL
jgi:hypothetical protein